MPAQHMHHAHANPAPSDFVRGYLGELHVKRLAPASMAAVLRDCEAAMAPRCYADTAEAGAEFCRNRQAGYFVAFSPVDVEVRGGLEYLC